MPGVVAAACLADPQPWSAELSHNEESLAKWRPTSFVQDTSDLWAKIDKFNGPLEISSTEKRHKGIRAVMESAFPKLEGDPLEIPNGDLRGAAIRTVQSCLDYATFLKKAAHNEALRGNEMNDAIKKAGACAAEGSAYIRGLVGKDKNFSFNGSFSADQMKLQREGWEYARDKCFTVGDHALASHTFGKSDIVPQTLAEVGSCIRSLGKAMHAAVVPPSKVGEEAIPAGAVLLACLAPPSVCGERRRRQRQRVIAECFLVSTAVAVSA